ncbi:hypothetical protein BCV70DRAFT_69556 [Testicularia cyperi]|uniref:Uncharacterized protein n=1 Tax=Testicularia cyperi TaxID=1882483 RepID=A0A317XHD1_9BASI|nr:hypothetical protein BCV70DRAFT_69556 [Testicularia cyperi]
MSSSAGGVSHLSTLSTALLAAACTALVASVIFVTVALRRYLKARKRRQSIRASMVITATAAQIYAARVARKSLATEDVSEPYLNHAPDVAHNAIHNLKAMSLAQKTLVSMRQQGFLPKAASPSPKLPDAALLSPRMPPSIASPNPQAPPRSPRSPGLTELTMSPGPSILLLPIKYGKSPSLSPNMAIADIHKKPAAQQKQQQQEQKKKKQTRSNIPSMLLRSLGVLPDLSNNSAATQTTDQSETPDGDAIPMASLGSQGSASPMQNAKDAADEDSLTPILDLGIDFGDDGDFQKSLRFQDTFDAALANDSGMKDSDASHKQQQDITTTKPKKPEVPSGMAALWKALSPVSASSSPPPSTTLLPYASSHTSSTRSYLPTPPPSAGLPPAPSSSSMSKQPSNISLQSKLSHSTLRSGTGSAASRSVSPASGPGRVDQVAIDMPAFAAANAEAASSSGFRPLSLGLNLSGSASQGTLMNMLGSLRKVSLSSRDDSLDLESANGSTTLGSSTSRSLSSEAISLSSSQTSFDSESTTSFGKANLIPAASVPPLPPMPVSLLRTPEEASKIVTETNFPSANEDQAEGASAPIAIASVSSRKRASTLGALDRPKIQLPDLMHPRAAPLPPKSAQQVPSVDAMQVQRASIMNLKSQSTDSLPLKAGSGAALNFTSPYHRALFPDPPLNENVLPFCLPPNSPILAQFGTSPSASPKPSFTDTVRARLSLSRKSFTSSPGFNSRDNTPRLSAIDLFPKPNSDLLKTLDHFSTTDSKPQDASSPIIAQNDSSRPLQHHKVKQLASSSLRPATSPVIGQQKSPTIMFNGEMVEPTRPLRLNKPGSAGGRLGGSPQLLRAEASPSPIMQLDRWASESSNSHGSDLPVASAAEGHSAGLVSPLVADSEGMLSPLGERIDFTKFDAATARSDSWMDSPEEACSPLDRVESRLSIQQGAGNGLMTTTNGSMLDKPVSNITTKVGVAPLPSPLQESFTAVSSPSTPMEEMATPRPGSNQYASGRESHLTDEELEYLSHRDSVLSVAASTISMASNSTCMTDSVGDDLELAADRRARLLASVQQNLAKAQAKDAKRESRAADRVRKSYMSRISHASHSSQSSGMSKSSSLRNIPEELSDGSQTMGLGLFEEADEEEMAQQEEQDQLQRQQQMPRPADPLTPPLTPVDASIHAKNGSRPSQHGQTPSTSSASSLGSSYSAGHYRQQQQQRMGQSKAGLAPLDVAAANRLSPSRTSGVTSPASSLKLRPLSLAASSTVGGSPMKRFEQPAFSPALSANIPSPSPAHVAAPNERMGRYNEEGRSSRSTTYRQGGVLPTISSKGALDTGRAHHVEPSLTHSDSTTSMGSMMSSLGSFSSRMSHFPSPIRSSFSNNSTTKITGMRPLTASSREESYTGLAASQSLYSTASSGSMSSGGGRLGYKSTELSTRPSADEPIETIS